MDPKWSIECPNCHKIIIYSTNSNWRKELRKNKKCCANCRSDFFKKNPHNLGRKFTEQRSVNYEELKIKLQQWSRNVKLNWNYTCAICGSRKKLQAHHIIPKALIPEYELVLENGLCLCETCHKDLHKKIGKPRR